MKIQVSRIENGVEICNTCIKAVNQPFRSMVKEGLGYKVEVGCVSEAHTGHVFDAWHLERSKRMVKHD